MDINIGSLYVNRTLLYLVPTLKVYGSTFSDKLNAITKLAFGVGDTLMEGTPYEGQRLIYIMIDKYVRTDLVTSFMNWIKNQEYYVTDYAVDETHTDRKHMIVIEFPESLGDIYDKFFEGKYSKMYVKEEVSKFFNRESEAKEVITKSSTARDRFKTKVKQDFDVELEISDLREMEFDYPPKKQEEIFNFKSE